MRGDALYLDSSALVKLAIRERESDALTAYLRSHRHRVSCALARVEVVRAVLPLGADSISEARKVLRRLRLLQLNIALLDDAADLEPYVLRSLDAIHLAAARTLGSSLSAVVTYDLRMISAAKELGMDVAAPGSNLA